MANVDISEVVSRLDRIERTLAQIGLSRNPVVDPPPEDLGRIRPDLLRLRLIDLLRHIVGHKVDPPPEDIARFRTSGLLETRLGDILRANPGWFVDPPPEDFLNVRILDLIRRWRGGFTDPAPDDLAHVRLSDLIQRIPGGGFTDPPPDEIGRLTRPELESQLHKIKAEQVRLQSLERLIQERLRGTAHAEGKSKS